MAASIGLTDKVVSQIPIIGNNVVYLAYFYDCYSKVYRVDRKLSQELKCLSDKISMLMTQIKALKEEFKKDQTSLSEIRSFKGIFEKNPSDFSSSLGQYVLKRGSFFSFLPSSLTEQRLCSLPVDAIASVIDDEEKVLEGKIKRTENVIHFLEKECEKVNAEKLEKQNQANLEKTEYEGIFFRKIDRLNKDPLLPNGTVSITSALGLAIVLGPSTPVLPAFAFCSSLQNFANLTIDPIIQRGVLQADEQAREESDFDRKLVEVLKEERDNEDDWVILTQGIEEAKSV